MVDYVNPGILGGYSNFRKLYEEPILAGRRLKKEGKEHLNATNELIEQYGKEQSDKVKTIE